LGLPIKLSTYSETALSAFPEYSKIANTKVYLL